MYRFKFECPHCQGQITASLHGAQERIVEDQDDAENLKTLVDLIDLQNEKIREAKSQLEMIKSKKKELLKQYLEESRQSHADYELQRMVKSIQMEAELES